MIYTYINFTCPPLPYLVTGGKAVFRQGDIHVRRTLDEVFDLIIMLKGRLYIEENDTQYTLKPQEFLILPPKRLHRGFKYCDTETEFYWLHFGVADNFSYSEEIQCRNQTKKKLKYIEKKENFYISILQYGKLNAENFTAINEYIQSLIDIHFDKRYHQHSSQPYSISQIKRQQLFFTILTILCDTQTNASNDLAQNIYDYLQLYYKHPFNLKNLSNRFAFHPTHIIRCIKKKYGKTPLQLLLAIRIDKAKKLLTSTDKTVHTIGLEVGFEDNAYFSKQFKQLTNMTPTQYRQKIIK